MGVSYSIVAGSMISLVGDSLFEERKKQDMASTSHLAAQVAPLLTSADSAGLQRLLEENAQELGVRLYVTDAYGKVQFDSEKTANGYHLPLP